MLEQLNFNIKNLIDLTNLYAFECSITAATPFSVPLQPEKPFFFNYCLAKNDPDIRDAINNLKSAKKHFQILFFLRCISKRKITRKGAKQGLLPLHLFRNSTILGEIHH